MRRLFLLPSLLFRLATILVVVPITIPLIILRDLFRGIGSLDYQSDRLDPNPLKGEVVWRSDDRR